MDDFVIKSRNFLIQCDVNIDKLL